MILRCAPTRAGSQPVAEAAASEVGIRGLLDSTKTFAMTIVDLLANSEIVNKAKEELAQNK